MSLTASELYEKAVATLPSKDIDHARFSSTLYLRRTPASKALTDEYEFLNQVTAFRDQIEHVMWYEIPFAYMPFWEGVRD